MAYKWTPPPGYAEFHIPGDPKTYRPGDMVPITKAMALHHMESGHAWEGLEAPDLPGPSGMPSPEPVAPKA